MSENPGSTVPRRQVGRHLRQLRTNAALPLREAAQAVEMSTSKLSRLEGALISPRWVDVEALCKVYGADDELTEALVALAKQAKTPGWWNSYGDVIPEGFSVYLGLESAADRIEWHEQQTIPGLIQTDGYMRTLAQMTPRTEEDLERFTELRLTRQRLLTRPTAAPRLRMVLDEAVLRRIVGGRAVMAEQLDHIAKLMELPNVDIRVVPFTGGPYLAMNGGRFTVLGFPQPPHGSPEPTTVYVEQLAGELYLDKPHEVAAYRAAWDDLWRRALDPVRSEQMARQIARELRSR
ncbi:helix-turn-helix domain-containing protein [Nocardiopsis sp. ARC36]